jgi:hypothetical protein
MRDLVDAAAGAPKARAGDAGVAPVHGTCELHAPRLHTLPRPTDVLDPKAHDRARGELLCPRREGPNTSTTSPSGRRRIAKSPYCRSTASSRTSRKKATVPSKSSVGTPSQARLIAFTSVP